MLSRSLNGKMSFSTLYPDKPLFYLAPRISHCSCFIRYLEPRRRKLDPKAIKEMDTILYIRVNCVWTPLLARDVTHDVTFFEYQSY